VVCVSVIAPQVNSPLVEYISNIQKLGLSIPLTPNNGEISDVFDILSLVMIFNRIHLCKKFIPNSEANH
jgi:hypothetical protein